MKVKYLVVVSLILAIFTLGAVSASDDVASDDSLAVEDASADEISVDAASDEAISGDVLSQDDDDMMEYDEDNIECYIEDKVCLEPDEDGDIDYIVNVYSYDSSETGTLKVYVDETEKFSKVLTSDDYDEDDEYYLHLDAEDLGITKAGTYNIEVTFDDEFLAEKQVTVLDYEFDMYANDGEESSSYFRYGDTISFNFYLPESANNKITFTINGKSYDVMPKNGYGKITLDSAKWNVGTYEAKATYSGDSMHSPSTISKIIYIEPKIDCPYKISVGEKQSITIDAGSGNGNVVVTVKKYNAQTEEYEQISVQNVAVTNGHAGYSLANLAEGEYRINVDYTIGSFSDYDYYYVDVVKNSPGFSSSVTPTEIIVGNNVNIKFTSPKLNDEVYIYLDGNRWKIVSMLSGQVNEIMSGLSVGTHEINIYYNDYGDDDDGLFYSNTVLVTVKPVPAPAKKADVVKLTLKKVTVKKSAKKVVLQATLKINGKAVKGKVIKFKFNKKTYKAKTNKKGIAKVTVKKAVLKKLKKGKKVTYTATYGKTTKKVTVKVKK